MNFKLWFVFLLAASLLVSVSEAGKDRRKKQKTRERLDDNDDNEEVTDGKSIDESGKGKGEKERTSVLEKQTEKNSKEESSSSEEEKDEENEKPDNSTIIIRRKRGAAVNFETNNAKLSSEKRAYSPKHYFVDPENTEHGRLIVRRDKYAANEGRFQHLFGSIRAKRANNDEGKILPTDAVFKTQRSKELNDGVQLSLSHKPAATASTN